MPITSLVSSLCVFIFITLSLRVIRMRGSGKGPSLGVNEDVGFLGAVRAHANFAEYTPFFLILLGLLEIKKFPVAWLLLFSVLFIAGRISHAYALGKKGRGKCRVIGMQLTLWTLLAEAIILVCMTILTPISRVSKLLP